MLSINTNHHSPYFEIFFNRALIKKWYFGIFKFFLMKCISLYLYLGSFLIQNDVFVLNCKQTFILSKNPNDFIAIIFLASWMDENANKISGLSYISGSLKALFILVNGVDYTANWTTWDLCRDIFNLSLPIFTKSKSKLWISEIFKAWFRTWSLSKYFKMAKIYQTLT